MAKQQQSVGQKHNKIVNILIEESKQSHQFDKPCSFPFVTNGNGFGQRFICKVVGARHIRLSSPVDAVNHLLSNYQEHNLTYRDAKGIVDLFIARLEPIINVAMTDFKDGNNWTFHRFDFERPNYMGCPHTFGKFLANSNNADAMAAFIGSILVENSNKHQYLWLYGQGKNGKSSLMRFMCKLLGSVTCTAQPEYILKNTFGTSMLMGKRLCMFPDTNNHKFVMSGLFKSLTGGDQVKIERKGEQAFNDELPTKFMISSNDMPTITAQDCDLRRIIFCELGKPQEFDPMFEDCLWIERAEIVAYCINVYHENLTSTGDIISDASQAEDIAKSGDYDSYEKIVDECFIIDENESSDNLWCSAADLGMVLKFIGMTDHNQQNNFKKHLRNVYNIASVVRKRNGKPRRIYAQLIVKDPKMTKYLSPKTERVVTGVDEHLANRVRKKVGNKVAHLPYLD